MKAKNNFFVSDDNGFGSTMLEGFGSVCCFECFGSTMFGGLVCLFVQRGRCARSMDMLYMAAC